MCRSRAIFGPRRSARQGWSFHRQHTHSPFRGSMLAMELRRASWVVHQTAKRPSHRPIPRVCSNRELYRDSRGDHGIVKLSTFQVVPSLASWRVKVTSVPFWAVTEPSYEAVV